MAVIGNEITFEWGRDWSARIADPPPSTTKRYFCSPGMTIAQQLQTDPSGWLAASGFVPTKETQFGCPSVGEEQEVSNANC